MRRSILVLVLVAACGIPQGDLPDGSLPDAPDAALEADSSTAGDLVPSNVGTQVSFDAGSADLVVKTGDRIVFRPYDGGIALFPAAGGSTMLRPAGVLGLDAATGIFYAQIDPTLGVFVVHSLRVDAGAFLQAATSSDRALVILVAGEARIDGVIDVGAYGQLAGAGGGQGGSGGQDGVGAGSGRAAPHLTNGNTRYGGGAGGAFGSIGGTGGMTIDAIGGAAGATYGAASLVPLTGGSGGGAGDGANAGWGGGGGGALQITARMRISVTGTITAGGGGAGGGQFVPFTHGPGGGGGGGGAGGAVLLEADVVELAATGRIAANGGGGGAGTPDCGANACRSNGANADAITIPAPGGGLPAAADSARGGHGSDASGGAGEVSPNAPSDDGGGGGGGAGRIRINTRSVADAQISGVLTPTQLTTIGRVSYGP